MTSTRTIARNTIYLTGGHFLMRLIGLFEIMALTRYLGPELYGTLALSYAYWGLFAMLVEVASM